jgi:hypothetical protein
MRQLMERGTTVSDYRELLLGCGRSRDKRVRCPANMTDQWRGLITLDSNRDVTPDVLCDLNNWVLHEWRKGWDMDEVIFTDGKDFATFRESVFDEVHAYEVVEHLGRQGDHRSFFSFFELVWRLMKPGGYFCGTCPSRFSPWLWGDPGHTRAILPETLIFLSQEAYTQCDQATPSMISDYRSIYHADFDRVRSDDDRTHHRFILQAVKPARHQHAG